MSNYYDENSSEFIRNTVDCNMDSVYSPFLKYLIKDDYILDAGCGSGRDTLYFLNQGYRVLAFDISEKMVEAATKLTGIQVDKISFLDIDYNNMFDAVWACASLLHLNREELVVAFNKLYDSLKKNGIMYCSFKLRSSDYISGERQFTCFTEESFKNLIDEIDLFDIIEIYSTHDSRESRCNELWLNCILKKKIKF